jgi:hypothetical protein
MSCCAGWGNPRAGARSPQLNLSEEDKVKVNNLITSLLNVNVKDNLLPVMKILFASLLMHFQYMLGKYGPNNAINSKLLFLARHYGIDKEKLLEWGSIIKKDFENKNEFDEIGLNSDESALNQVLSLLRILHSENREQKTHIQSLEARIDDLVKLKTVNDAQNFTPSKRKHAQLENNETPNVHSQEPTPSPVSVPPAPKNALEMMMSSGGIGYELAGLQGLELKSLLANSIIYDFKGKPTFSKDKRIREKCFLVLEFMMKYATEEENCNLNQRRPQRTDASWATYEKTIHTVSSIVAEKAFSALGTLDNKKGKPFVNSVSERIRAVSGDD